MSTIFLFDLSSLDLCTMRDFNFEPFSKSNANLFEKCIDRSYDPDSIVSSIFYLSTLNSGTSSSESPSLSAYLFLLRSFLFSVLPIFFFRVSILSTFTLNISTLLSEFKITTVSRLYKYSICNTLFPLSFLRLLLKIHSMGSIVLFYVLFT